MQLILLYEGYGDGDGDGEGDGDCHNSFVLFCFVRKYIFFVIFGGVLVLLSAR